MPLKKIAKNILVVFFLEVLDCYYVSGLYPHGHNRGGIGLTITDQPGLRLYKPLGQPSNRL